jgi:hypothetical protein
LVSPRGISKPLVSYAKPAKQDNYNNKLQIGGGIIFGRQENRMEGIMA